MQPGITDYVKLHFIVLIWGFTAILGVLITIPAVEIVFFRTLLASIALAMLLLYRKVVFSIGRNAIFKILGTGVLIAAHWILFFAAARVATVSVTLAGMATCSLFTSFLEPMVTKRKIKSFEVGLGVFVLIGLYIIFRFEFDHALGIFMALCSAALAALFTVINGQFTRKFNPYLITFYEMIGACVGTLAFFPLYQHYFAVEGQLQLFPTDMDWVYIVILAVVCTVYAYSVSVELMQKISAYMLNLTVNLEPVYGIVLAYLIFGADEKMTIGFYIGTSIILCSVLAYPLFNRRYKRKALELDPLR